MTYPEFRATRTLLESAERTAATALKQASGTEKGAMGLTPDHIRARPEWKIAKAAWQRSWDALRAFNARHVKQFKKEIKAEIAEKRNRQLQG